MEQQVCTNLLIALHSQSCDQASRFGCKRSMDAFSGCAVSTTKSSLFFFLSLVQSESVSYFGSFLTHTHPSTTVLGTCSSSAGQLPGDEQHT